MLRIQELQAESVYLHRDMLSMSNLLNLTALEVFPNISPYSRDYLGDTTLLGLYYFIFRFIVENLYEYIYIRFSC